MKKIVVVILITIFIITGGWLIMKAIQEKGTTLAMVKEWQAFYENEVQRNPCNPTAPYRAELMKKIAWLWG